MKRLSGYGREESQDDWELKKPFARSERRSEVSGEELVGGWRSEVDIVKIGLAILFVIASSSVRRLRCLVRGKSDAK